MNVTLNLMLSLQTYIKCIISQALNDIHALPNIDLT